METNKTIKSWSNGKDCFNYYGAKTIDHIWPTSKDGSNSIENQQFLSEDGNIEKADKTKGYVNDIRFSVEPAGESDSGKKIGVMYILKNNEWYRVIR